MRTTLDIDEDVLLAVKELAAKERKSAGKVLSEVFRRTWQNPTSQPGSPKHRGPAVMNKVPILASRGDIVTLAHVNRVMEEEGI